MPPPCILSCIEWDGECQKELSTLADGIGQDFCIFGDISNFWRPELQEVVQALEKEAGIFRRGFVRPDKSQAGNAPQGVLHQTPTHVPLADSKEAFSRVVVYGPLCPGSSLRPFRQEYPSFLSWIGLRLECLESEVDLENVSQFPTDVILRFFTDYYHVEVVNLDPRMLGTLGLAQRVASLISLI